MIVRPYEKASRLRDKTVTFSPSFIVANQLMTPLFLAVIPKPTRDSQSHGTDGRCGALALATQRTFIEEYIKLTEMTPGKTILQSKR